MTATIYGILKKLGTLGGIVSALDEECDWTLKTGPRGLVDIHHIGLFYPLDGFKNTNHLSDEFRDWNSPKAQALANQIIQTVDYYDGTRRLDIQTGEVGIRIVDATKKSYANGKTFRRLHLKSIETELGRVNPPLEEEEEEETLSELDMAPSQVSQISHGDNGENWDQMRFRYPQNSFAGSMNVPSMSYAPPPGQVPGNLPPNSSYMQAAGMYPSAVQPLTGPRNFPQGPASYAPSWPSDLMHHQNANSTYSTNSACTRQGGSEVLSCMSAGTNQMSGSNSQYPAHPQTYDPLQMSYGSGREHTSQGQYPQGNHSFSSSTNATARSWYPPNQ